MYLKHILLGTTTGGEVWTVGFCFDPSGEISGWNQADGDAQAAAAGAVVPGSNLLSAMGPAMQWTGIRLEGRDDATDKLLGFSEYLRPVPLVGLGSVKLPPQNALVISLMTSTPGARGRGRVYWPGMGIGVGSAGRLNTPAASDVLGDLKSYLSAVQAAIIGASGPVVLDLAVRSRTAKASPHVTSMRCGDVIDTQRRRRDKLPETYVSVTYP